MANRVYPEVLWFWLALISHGNIAISNTSMALLMLIFEHFIWHLGALMCYNKTDENNVWTKH